MDVKLKTTTTKEYQTVLTRQELLVFLAGRGQRLPYDLPADTRLSILIPAGGDYYAGSRLDLDEVDGIIIEWKATEVK